MRMNERALGLFAYVPITTFSDNDCPNNAGKTRHETGAAHFKPKKDDGSSIVVAYLLDERGNVLAAASKDDMDMGSRFGCVLTFDVTRYEIG
jgi:hypothetical protein